MGDGGLRTCIHNRMMQAGQGIFPPCKAKNRSNTWCIARFFPGAKSRLRRLRLDAPAGAVTRQGGKRPGLTASDGCEYRFLTPESPFLRQKREPLNRPLEPAQKLPVHSRFCPAITIFGIFTASAEALCHPAAGGRPLGATDATRPSPPPGTFGSPAAPESAGRPGPS